MVTSAIDSNMVTSAIDSNMVTSAIDSNMVTSAIDSNMVTSAMLYTNMVTSAILGALAWGGCNRFVIRRSAWVIGALPKSRCVHVCLCM